MLVFQNKINLLENKKIIHAALIFFILMLHAVLRISEIPYSMMSMGIYHFIPAVNVAAEKGFTEDSTFLRESPELAKFFNSMPYGQKAPEKFSLFNSVYDFKDYNVKVNLVTFVDSIGYRLLLGYVWKVFGYNWYFVGFLNYIFSLMALASLLFCSYRVLGIAYSVMIGLIFSLSTPEINFISSFGRDGFPLWFASYLICALIMFVNKPLTLNRVISYSVLLGIIIFLSIQGRSSCIYFLPLVFIIYFILFFLFQREKINFKYGHLLKNLLAQKIFLFFLASSLTLFSAIIPLKLTYSFLGITSVNHFMHIMVLGLGVWSLPYFRYDDSFVWTLGEEYGRRVFEWQILALSKFTEWYGWARGEVDSAGVVFPFSEPLYNESLKSLYLAFIKMYPFSFLRTVFYRSFYETLLYLGFPYYTIGGYGKFLHSYTFFVVHKGYLFIFSFIGAVVLYFRMNLQKTAVILVSFVLFNASVSFLQYNSRHVLMGHTAYYFLCGTTLGFIFDNYLLRFFYFCLRFFGVSANSIASSATGRAPQKIHIKKEWKNLFLFLKNHSKKFITAILLILGISLLIKSLSHVEKRNMQDMQAFFDSLDKIPLKFDVDKKEVKLPVSAIGKTVGIFCEVGRVTDPKGIEVSTIQIITINKATIVPVIGENVVVFFPVFIRDADRPIKFLDNGQCKAYYWSDLKSWQGPLWEGSYDRNNLSNEHAGLSVTK